MYLSVFVSALSLFCCALLSPRSTFNGDWVGSMQISNVSLPVFLRVSMQDGNLKGTIDIVEKGIRDAPFTIQNSDPEKIQFSLQTDTVKFDFAGTLKEERVTGEVRSGTDSGTFQLIRLVKIDPAQNQQYFGIYEFAPDRYFYVRTWDELGKQQLTYFDSNGAAGAMFATSPNSFFSGPGVLNPLPEQVFFQFSKEKDQIRLSVKEKNGPEKSAARLNSYKEEEIRFGSIAHQLSGTLFLPLSEQPHPAIVLVHGSGPVSRDFMGPIAYHFVRKGIAVLAYDKPGIGQSEGNWMEMDFTDMAKDALAGVAYLKTRKEIDPGKIGLWGISQGGWIAPLAASMSNDVSFLILVSAAAVTPEEQQIQATEAELRIQKLSDEKINEAVQSTKQQFDLLRSDETRLELEKEVVKLKKEGNSELLSKSGLQNPLFLLFYRRILDYDPIPVLEKTNRPTLIIYGELDATVPRKENQEKLEAALIQAGNTKYKTLVFPRGNHALMESQTGSNAEFPYLYRFVSGFFDSMTDWIHSL